MHLLTCTPIATSFKEGMQQRELTDGHLHRGKAGGRWLFDHARIIEVTRIWMSDVRGIDFFTGESVLPVECGKDCQQECYGGIWEATWHLNAIVVWSVIKYLGDPLLKEIVITAIFWRRIRAIWQDPTVGFVLAYCCTHRWSQTVTWREHSLLVLWAMLGGLWGPCRV